MPLQTYGEKPKSFQLSEGSDELFMIGSEVGTYLRMMRGSIYKRYPYLWKRMASGEERKKMTKFANHPLPAHVMIVRAKEIDDLIDGNDAQFKTESQQLAAAAKDSPSASNRKTRQTAGKQDSLFPNLGPNHLDAVPAGTPISRHRVGNKRVKTFPTW